MNKERHAYSIMVVPEREGKTAFSFRISRRRVIFLSACIGIAIISMGILIFKSVQAARKVSYFYTIIRENEELKKENIRLRQISEKIGRMDTFAAYIGSLASLKKDSTATKTYEEFISAGSDDRVEPQKGDSSKETNISSKTGPSAVDPIKKEEVDFSTALPSQLPVEGWITQPYVDESVRGKVEHLGIDIAAAEGKNIKAPAPGVVEGVFDDQYYGKLLIIKHAHGFSTKYGHCQKFFVSPGDTVQRDQIIALVGNTGHSTAPHLHYEILKDGKTVNPLDILRSANKK